MKKPLPLIAGLAALALVLGAATLPGPASSAAAEPGGITVSGTGSVSVVPDRAELSFGVESQGATAKAALAANAAEMRKVIAAVKAGGGENVRTQAVSLSPRYDEQSKVQAFVAVNTVSATTTVARAGALIDAAVGAGANQVYGPSLSRGDASAQYRDALKAAVADARASAQALAAASGLSLGRISAIVEGGGAQPLPFAGGDKAVESGATPVEGGSQRIVATVSVTFAAS